MAVAFWPCRAIVSLLLILAVLPLFFSAPTPHSQTLTTITSLQTITTESTVTTARPVTSYMTKTTVLTEFSTATSYYLKARIAYKSKILLDPVSSPGYGCTYRYAAFTAKKNETLAVSVTSTRPIVLFVMPSGTFRAWGFSLYCRPQSGPVYVCCVLDEAWYVQEYSQRLVIPNDGEYYLVFENWSHEDTATIDIVAQLTGVLSESSSVVPTSTVLTSHSTITETYPTTITRVLTSVWTEEVGLLEQNTLLIGAAVVVVVALLGVLILRSRRK